MARVDGGSGRETEVPRGKLLRVIIGKSPFVYQNRLYKWIGSFIKTIQNSEVLYILCLPLSSLYLYQVSVPYL